MPKESDFFLLMHIAEKAGSGTTKLSTSTIARDLEISQQSVSRKLRELEKNHFVKRKATSRGIELSVTNEGRLLLKKHFYSLKKLFNSRNEKKSLAGKVVSGLGEGKYYLSFEKYFSQIKSKLGFNPFKGTLNLAVDENGLIDFISSGKEITIEGFETAERNFGAIKCFPVLINGKVDGALVLPERSVHKNVAELIAPLNLRKKFSLKDGGKINFELR